MKKILMIGLTLIGLAGVGWVFAHNALATAATISNQPVVDKLAERFGLNAGEVGGVFDEARQERQRQMQEQQRIQMEEKLDEAVADGVITSDQKQSLLNKQTEMRQKQQQLQEEWQQWRDESGIDF